MKKAVSCTALDHQHREDIQQHSIQQQPAHDIEHLQCTICYDVRDGAIYQCREGHLICTECLDAYHQHDKKNCPSCKVPMLEQIRSRAVEEQIGRIPVVCTHCHLTFKRGIISSHQAVCPKRVVACTAAVAECPWSGSFEALELHEKVCPHMGVLLAARKISQTLIDQNEQRVCSLDAAVHTLTTEKIRMKSELHLLTQQLERGQKRDSLLHFALNWAVGILVFATVVGVAAGVLNPTRTATSVEQTSEASQLLVLSQSHKMLHATAVDRFLAAKDVAMGAMVVVGFWLSMMHRWEWPVLKCLGITLGTHHIFTAFLYLVNLFAMWQVEDEVVV